MRNVKKILPVVALAFGIVNCGGSSDETETNTDSEVNLIGSIAWWSDVVVPPGYVGYVYKTPRAFKRARANNKTEYVGVYSGPYRETHGGEYYYKTILINKQWNTYSEKFNILAKDELNVEFSAHIRLRPKSDEDSVRFLVENFGGGGWYDQNVKEPVRTFVRDSVQQYPATEIKANRITIENEISKNLKAYFADKPFEVDTVSVGNIDYPDVVEKAVERKLAREQELEENAIKVQIAEEKKRIKLINAGAEAEAQKLLRETVNDKIIALRGIEALEKFATSENKVIYFMPNDGISLLNNINPEASKESK